MAVEMNLKTQFLELFRKLNAEMPIQMAVVFMHIVMDEGLTMSELYVRSGISQASCSRNVAALSAYHRLNKAGLGLVHTKIDPRERRRKLVFFNRTRKKTWRTAKEYLLKW